MSNKHLTLAFKADISPTMKFTLIAVCDSVDEDGSWKLRYETIASKTSQSRRAVMGHIKSLSEMGVISIKKTRRDDGRQGANIFTVEYAQLEAIQSADIDKIQSADIVISETQSADSDISRVQMSSFQSAANDTPTYPPLPTVLPTKNPPCSSPIDLNAAFDAWNEFALSNNLSVVQVRSSERKKALGMRLKECGGIDGWTAALELVGKSRFLLGHNERGWKADFDFVVTKKKFIKIMEGGYPAPPLTDTQSALEGMRAEI